MLVVAPLTRLYFGIVLFMGCVFVALLSKWISTRYLNYYMITAPVMSRLHE